MCCEICFKYELCEEREWADCCPDCPHYYMCKEKDDEM